MKKKKEMPIEFDIEDLERYQNLSPKKKLQYLEEMNIFLCAFMPPASKKMWEKLKKLGW